MLSELTTLRVGGAADSVVTASTREELRDAALEAWGSGEWLVLGGGSNVVVSDAGFPGTVILAASRGVERLDGEGVLLRVEAGESWDGLVAHAVAQGWSGIEALSGIPGSVGAAPIQNIGAYGQELSDVLVAVEFLDYVTGEQERIPAAELGLGYRMSDIKAGRQGVVLAVELRLEERAEGVIRYSQLASALGVESAPVAAIRDGVLALRASKGMVLDPADPDSVSCGSFFTNPIVSENFARGLPPETPQWLVDDVVVKLSAAWLIEKAGIGKGFSLPGSRIAISSKHTLAFTNRGGGTAEQVGELARYIRAMVLARFGVDLQPEPVAVGVEL
ncbi:MAG: UDP-N-acetylenolpyruvoylglucosamine reductase [Micrococcales bacterium 70-64]|nr:UDP-N-acetylmuramate dehydrogenase [Leifsonia sp.]ODU63339.1 MAG: UDP-N-acetylenolpyruvoylglucosamine reductase [Leifsonia sp. SCN 70-46]OJX87105.1 MAG: UDP-N-acetylenolpyruvoylglucosamine reductase [Micrococcales bacterium 70-64]